VTKTKQFFRLCILLKLAGKWCARNHKLLLAIQPNIIVESDDGVQCYCQRRWPGCLL